MSGLIHERSAEQVRLDAEVLARVKRGMALLEERFGPGWVDLVDLAALDLVEGDRCVLGQVCGGYSNGLDDLGGEDGPWSDAHGFSIYSDDIDGWWPHERDDGWEVLQRAWELELRPLKDAL